MLVFASSKVTTASPFSRLMSALVTPLTLVNDLFTEISHDTHVIPDTASVTVLISAKAAPETTASRTNIAALISFFIAFPFRKSEIGISRCSLSSEGRGLRLDKHVPRESRQRPNHDHDADDFSLPAQNSATTSSKRLVSFNHGLARKALGTAAPRPIQPSRIAGQVEQPTVKMPRTPPPRPLPAALSGQAFCSL